MRADLNRRVSLLEPVRAAAPGGGAALSFDEVGVVWAAIAAESARERGRFETLQTATRFSVRIRHRGDVKPGWRAGWAGRVRRVTAAYDPDGSRQFLILICEDET